MDLDLNQTLIFGAKVGIFSPVILVVAVILWFWIMPCLHQMYINRHKDPEPENEETIEMEVVNREVNIEHPSHENEAGPFNSKINP